MKNTKLKSTNTVVIGLLGVAFIGVLLFAISIYQSNSKNIEMYDNQVKKTEDMTMQKKEFEQRYLTQEESLKNLEEKMDSLDKDFKKETENNRILRGKVDKLGKKNEEYKVEINSLEGKLKEKQARAKKAKELELAQQKQKEESVTVGKSSDLKGKVASSATAQDKSNAVTTASTKKKEVVSRGGGYKSNFRASFYTANCPTGCTGQSASGVWVNKSTHYQGRRVVAMPKRIPLHTKIKIYYADGTVEDGIVLDRGRDIVGDRTDILVASREEAYAKGRQNVKIEVVK